ncbi:MAG: hypothetical protein LBU79_08735 [Planctomycetota bacterium]|jgi:uncharacterized repeat protein (TIGR04138 family)|nr:hypothetical protein [Planctomycetota bacterium]
MYNSPNAQRIQELAREDGRYAPAAFHFIEEAITETVKLIKNGKISSSENAPSRSGNFHVSAQELMNGVVYLARDRWGMLGGLVLEHWGVRRSEDFGEIVFLMVMDPDIGWGRRENDQKEDFANTIDFSTAFDPWID